MTVNPDHLLGSDSLIGPREWQADGFDYEHHLGITPEWLWTKRALMEARGWEWVQSRGLPSGCYDLIMRRPTRLLTGGAAHPQEPREE